MTDALHGGIFLRATWSAFPAIVISVGLSACGSAPTQQARPTGVAGAPINTGQYPNLNIAPGRAAEQLTPSEQQATVRELTAVRQQQAARGTARPAASEAELKKLAKTHAEATLKEIQAE